MGKYASRPAVATLSIVLLVWLSLGPIVCSALSFADAMPTRWPALEHFASTPVFWRVAFFGAGCFGLLAAWLVFVGRFRLALGAVIAFAAVYVPVFPVVWAQQTIAMVGAVVVVFFVGYLSIKSRGEV